MLPGDAGSKNKFKSEKERYRSYISLLLVVPRTSHCLSVRPTPTPSILALLVVISRLTSICPAPSTALRLRIGVPK